MRILHVFASFATGGLEMRAAQLMGMMRRDVQNTVIALDGRTDTLARIPEGVRVQVVDPPGGGGLIGRLRAIRRVLRGVEPDLVLTHNWGTIEWVLAGQLADRCSGPVPRGRESRAPTSGTRAPRHPRRRASLPRARW